MALASRSSTATNTLDIFECGFQYFYTLRLLVHTVA